jgi:hypothetical protein
MTIVNLPENDYQSSGTHPWCAYCFRILDPEDRQVDLRKFVQCTHCASYYHANCWQKNSSCIKCRGSDAITVDNLLYLPSTIKAKPVQAAVVKPSAIYYYVAGNAYEVPSFVFEHVIPAYEYWRPRVQATLLIWHTKAKEITREGLVRASRHSIVRENFPQIQRFIQLHLHILTQILVYTFYVITFLLIRLLLRLTF